MAIVGLVIAERDTLKVDSKFHEILRDEAERCGDPEWAVLRVDLNRNTITANVEMKSPNLPGLLSQFSDHDQAAFARMVLLDQGYVWARNEPDLKTIEDFIRDGAAMDAAMLAADPSKMN